MCLYGVRSLKYEETEHHGKQAGTLIKMMGEFDGIDRNEDLGLEEDKL